ncbi:MAG: N-succinylarginine dihydrolase [Henriciella sp.]|nr:N-succinylarginine dihydrolase [Henriciella sp.]MBO6696276.1 N-succinylarginine dihydrolase [Henriciella sp.]
MSSTETLEVNFDGLIGPSHNYGGMSDGNLASQNNAGDVSNPREGALQGLEKMRMLVRAGFVQGVLPPLERPNLGFLVDAGFNGADEQIVEAAAKTAPSLLKAAYSASSMWTANAATISPSADTEDGRLHLTAANLSSMLHRSIEHPETTSSLAAIFDNEDVFAVHAALPMHADFSDEGAANHVRLSAKHGAAGVELFVFGREAGESVAGFPARQTSLASQSIVRSHSLKDERTVLARQSETAINAGAFHNDVVCVGTLDTLFFHEQAFEDTEAALHDLRLASEGLFDLKLVMVPDDEVPLSDAIKSYLFNSQLLKWPGEDRLVLLAPLETQEIESTRTYCERLVQGNGPIGRVQFVDVRQSMRNGGGPACLRLRVVMTPEERAACHQGVLLNEARIDELQDVVRETYRDRLSVSDLADPGFVNECLHARERLLRVLDLGRLI